ncbi:MAG: response regulator [Gemmatimonadota bacterium]|nr:response regulator [Gemmatimonadota bacterium]
MTSGLAGLRILVVEDNFLAADAASFLLEELGHEVVGPVASIAEALACAERDPIDLALLDVDVRGQAVTPVAERLRARDCPIVFVTAFTADGLPPGCDDAPVLGKPFDEWSLRKALRSALTTDS